MKFLMAWTSPDSWTNAGSRAALESLEAVAQDAAAILVWPIGAAGTAVANRSELPVVAELAVDLVVITCRDTKLYLIKREFEQE